MMIKHTFLLLALLVFMSAQTQTRLFPKVSCTNLKDKTVELPADVAGKRTVIALMLSTKADKQMQKWVQPLYNALLADGMGGMMGGNIYNAQLCFVGAVKGLAKLALPEMIKKAKKEVDTKYHSQFMYTDSNTEDLIKQLNIGNTNEPFFIVLEKDGSVLFETSGAYSEDKMNSITDALLK